MNILYKSVMVLGMVVVSSAFGSPTVGYIEQWVGTGPTDTEGWQADITYAAASVENFNHTLQLTIPGASSTPISGVYADSSSSGGNFVGDGKFKDAATTAGLAFSDLVISFKLRTLNNYNGAPDSMWMYFESGNGNQYYYNFPGLSQPAVSDTPKPYHFVISSAGNWLGSGIFNNDFNDIIKFGLGFSSTLEGGDHIIQLSDFGLTQELRVPEPENVWMMVMVLASLALTFRGRLADLGNQVKARFVA